MVWYLFALLGAMSDSTFYMLSKKLLRNIDQYVLAAWVFLTSSVALLLISIIRGVPAIGPAFYSSVLVTGILNVIAAILYYKALRITDLSLSIPMISFTPVFLIFTSLVLLDEFPAGFGIVGILLIVTGSYILNASRKNKRLFDPFRKMFENTGVIYMLVVAFLFSISANFDKLVVKNSDPYFGSAVVFLFIGCTFLIISYAKNGRVSSPGNYSLFLVVGMVLALEAVTINIAYTMSIVPYVISLKRLSIMFSVLFGGLVFNEENILQRGIGAAVMVAGVVLIIVS